MNWSKENAVTLWIFTGISLIVEAVFDIITLIVAKVIKGKDTLQ